MKHQLKTGRHIASELNKQWYVIFTEKGRERAIETTLFSKGYEVYCPTVYKDRRILRNVYKAVLVEPLFPCYFFINLSLEDDWEGVKIFGEKIQVLKGASGYPDPLEPGIIDLLKSREDGQGVLKIGSWRYQKDDDVLIKSGPFEHHPAVVDAVVNRDIFVILDILGRKNRVRLEESQVQPV